MLSFSNNSAVEAVFKNDAFCSDKPVPIGTWLEEKGIQLVGGLGMKLNTTYQSVPLRLLTQYKDACKEIASLTLASPLNTSSVD